MKSDNKIHMHTSQQQDLLHPQVKANKRLFILRSLRKEDYYQAELDHLFSSIALPSITYGLSVYGASEAELTAMQCFLDRCYKRKYTSQSFSIKNLLESRIEKYLVRYLA